LGEFAQLEPFMMAAVDHLPEADPGKSAELEALQRNVIAQFQQIVTTSPTLSDELQTIALNIEDPGRLVDFIASSLPFLATTDKQELLETPDVMLRMERINKHLAKEAEVQQLRNKIQTEVQDQVQQSQRDYYLREQLKAIQKEIGVAAEDRSRRHAGRGEERSHQGAQPALADVSHGGRLLAHAQLRRVAGGTAVG
jgi:ATP-dependent Lon protease